MKKVLIALPLVLAACATANTPQQNLAYDRWAKCTSAYVHLERIDVDGRITFMFTSSSSRLEVQQCLAAAGRGGPPLPEALGIRPPGGP